MPSASAEPEPEPARYQIPPKMIARLHNNKAASKTSGPVCPSSVPSPSAHKSPCTRRPAALRRPPTSRRRRASLLKLARLCPATVAMHKAAPSLAPRAQRISIRAHLPRPAPLDIDEEALRKACPGLAKTPLNYAREGLKELSTHLYAGLQGAIPQHHPSQLPDELQVLLSDPISHGTVCPTHVLAVTSSSPAPSHKAKFTLFPAHQLVLGAHCAALPHFPHSAAAHPLPASTGNSVTLPVVRLAVPAPAQFALLLWHLYVQDPLKLRRSLLPAGWDADVNAMMERVHVVHGLWANACVLRVVDPEVFEVVQEVWGVVLGAISKATGAPLPAPLSS